MAARDLSGVFEERIRAIVQPLLDDAVNRMMGAFLGMTGGGVPRRGPGRPPKTATAAAAGEEACNVAGCVRPMRSKGYCAAHYQAARKYGWPMPAPVGFNAPVRRRGRPPRSGSPGPVPKAAGKPGRRRGRKPAR